MVQTLEEKRIKKNERAKRYYHSVLKHSALYRYKHSVNRKKCNARAYIKNNCTSFYDIQIAKDVNEINEAWREGRVYQDELGYLKVRPELWRAPRATDIINDQIADANCDVLTQNSIPSAGSDSLSYI